jgi:signal transduction histidine kinase
LRFVLAVGFGGMLLIFLIAGIDAIRLLRNMRETNKILHDGSIERSRRLGSVRGYVLLTQAYMGDYLLDSDQETARDHLEQLQGAWSQMISDLANYQTTTLEEEVLMKRIQALLNEQWRDLNRAMTASVEQRRTAVRPLRTAVFEITTRVEDADARQHAWAESGIQREFENMGRQLTLVLEIALGAAILLAAGCVVYVLRIERENKRRYQEIAEARGALEQLSARLLDAQEEERRSISRELHDEIGQTLTAVLVDAANLANRIPADDAESRRYLENIRGLADSSVNSIRNIALLLRPSMLDDLGLIPALEWQAREVSRRSGIKIKVTDENVPDSLPDAVRTCIYRVVQEALNNVARHSGATSASVNVRRQNGSLELTVTDEGTGFNPGRTRGIGLLGMEERVKQLGGKLEVRSEMGKRTTLRVTLPIAVVGSR